MYLEPRRGVPPLFWDEVDKLSTRLVAMLLPIYNYTVEFQHSNSPPVEDLHQWIHEVVAYAGWLNVCIRLSPSIIDTEWPTPGDELHFQYENLSQEVFEYSRARATYTWKRSGKPNRPGYHGGWVARVKIAAAPKIVRRTPTNDEFGVQGTTSYTLMKAHVVYYYGRHDEAEERQLFLSRADFVDQLRRHRSVPHSVALAVMVLAVLMVLLWYTDCGLAPCLRFGKLPFFSPPPPVQTPKSKVWGFGKSGRGSWSGF